MENQPPIFRVTGIPSTTTTSQLIAALTRETKGTEPPIEVDAVLCDSCSTRSLKKTALVLFRPQFPSYLNCLFGNATTPPKKRCLQVEIEQGLYVAIDVDFYGLTQLHSTTPGVAIKADIVAVAGLNGHAYESWRSKNSIHKMWLRDFLPNRLPECRTMVYGYDSKIDGYGTEITLDYARDFLEELKRARRSPEDMGRPRGCILIASVDCTGPLLKSKKPNLDQEQQRPIIFIGQSYGGIVIVQTLMKARDIRQDVDPILHGLYGATYGILFFGTPHRGILTNDIRKMVKSPHKQALLDSIAPGAEPLTSILERFIDDADQFKIISFYEINPTRTLVQQENGTNGTDGATTVGTITDRNSSILNLPARFETKIPIPDAEVIRFDNETGTCETAMNYIENFVDAANGGAGGVSNGGNASRQNTSGQFEISQFCIDIPRLESPYGAGDEGCADIDHEEEVMERTAVHVSNISPGPFANLWPGKTEYLKG